MSETTTIPAVYELSATVTEKLCRRCKVVKPAAEMKRDTRNRDGFSSFCKDCHQASTIQWQKNNPERLNSTRRKRYVRIKDQLNKERNEKYRADPMPVRWANLRRFYRVTKEWYEEKLAEQGGCCAICGCHQAECRRRFAVDHDHSCCAKTPTCGNCNRGLLCDRCNTAIHAAERDLWWLMAVAAYLEGYSHE